MAKLKSSFDVPFRDQVLERTGLLTLSWTGFFRSLFDRVYPLGYEDSFELLNNQSVAADIVGLKFNQRGVSAVWVDFLIQRITSSSELIEQGTFKLSYNPTANDWNITLTDINTPDNSGVDFTVTSTCQVKYTSTNISGDPVISKISWRASTLAGRNPLYSVPGAR